jgi:selenide,water dikinase
MTDHHIVLVGGGHSHVQALRALAERPQPGGRLTLVSDRPEAPYSGMLPGHIAGLYPRAAMHIDLSRLAALAAAEFVEAAAVGLERPGKSVVLADGRRIPYDTLSLNIGITPDLSRIVGAARFGLAVKPIGSLLAKLDEALGQGPRAKRPKRILVVGGGPAGVELALALRAHLAREAGLQQPWIGIASGGVLVATLNGRARAKLSRILSRKGIDVLSACRIGEVTADGARAEDGRWIPADLTIIATAARGQSWLAGAGLPLSQDGSVLVGPTLASTGDAAVFAAGDCAEIAGNRREKAGVYAVRQGLTLADNLRRRITGEPLLAHRPQSRALAIVATGDRRAVASWGPWLAAEGRWVWWWKDVLDRRFVNGVLAP